MLRNFAREMRTTFIFHAVASHFVNGLVPVAVLFMLLTLVTTDIYFEHTVIHLMGVASLTVPISFISGIRDWRTKFHGGRAPVFYRKIKLSIILALLCGAIVSIRILWPNPLATGGIIAWLYGACIAATLPVVILLGHYGGKLAYLLRQKPMRDGMP
jgi:peptidoglycan biosynthesis protein MviN/MurJ (putative lipid II flippase)